MKKLIIIGLIIKAAILLLLIVVFFYKKNKKVRTGGLYPESDDYANPLFKKYFKHKWRCEADKLRKEMKHSAAH